MVRYISYYLFLYFFSLSFCKHSLLSFRWFSSKFHWTRASDMEWRHGYSAICLKTSEFSQLRSVYCQCLHSIAYILVLVAVAICVIFTLLSWRTYEWISPQSDIGVESSSRPFSPHPMTTDVAGKNKQNKQWLQATTNAFIGGCMNEHLYSAPVAICIFVFICCGRLTFATIKIAS